MDVSAPKSNVAVLTCSEYALSDVYDTIKKSIDLLGGVQSFVKKGDNVLLKPNMFRPSKQGTTHPSVVHAVAKIFKEEGAHVFLTDSPMVHSLEEVARFTGVADVCNELDIAMLPIKAVNKKAVRDPQRSQTFFLPQFLDEMDLLVNLPKIKSHPLTVFSGSVKNMFGLCTGTTKSQFHLRFKKKYDFCHMLLDLYSVVRPELTIMDAVQGVDSTGCTKQVGAILTSNDAIALDVVACNILGIPADTVLTNALGEERSLGVARKDRIEILGDVFNFPLIDGFEYELNHREAISSMTISMFDSFFLKNSIGKPHITDSCKRCAECVALCPTAAITVERKKARIEYNKCIRCYCCQEICPNNAVVVKEPNRLFLLLASLLQKEVIKLRSFESQKTSENNDA